MSSTIFDLPRRPLLAFAVILTSFVLLPSGPASAGGEGTESTPSCHGSSHQEAQEAQAPAPEVQAAQDRETRLRIPDMALTNQEGKPIHFYTDLVKDKVVAMNFIFTTCTTICPPMGANFSRLQDELGDRLGRDVQLVSVSIDPTTDTPQRLKAWGEKFSASSAWTFVTGLKTDVDQVLRELEVLSPDFKDHGPVVLLVNDRTGAFRRVNGLTPPAKLASMLDEMLDSETASLETSDTEETAR